MEYLPMSEGGILILAGHSRSPFALLLLDALARSMSPPQRVEAVVLVSEWQWRRWTDFRRRWRGRVLNRIRSFFPSRFAWSPGPEVSIYEQRLRSTGLLGLTLPALCSRLKVPLHRVMDPNSNDCLRILDARRPSAVIYAGGGILREPFLQRSGMGTLNVHSGPLPHVRGVNAVEWSLFLGIRPTATLHWIDKGIDTGPVIASRTIEVAAGDSLEVVRGRTVMTGLDLLVENLDSILSGSRKSYPQLATEGVQYYAMCETIRHIVQDWIDSGVTPTWSASEIHPNDRTAVPLRPKRMKADR